MLRSSIMRRTITSNILRRIREGIARITRAASASNPRSYRRAGRHSRRLTEGSFGRSHGRGHSPDAESNGDIPAPKKTYSKRATTPDLLAGLCVAQFDGLTVRCVHVGVDPCVLARSQFVRTGEPLCSHQALKSRHP